MTFDEVMDKYSGKWDGKNAVIQDRSGYYWIIATGKEGDYTITKDGERFVTSVDEAPEESKPVARRGRKAVKSVDE